MSEQASPSAPKPAPAGERIAKALSRAGVASRREAERMIEAGEVTVNGKVITSPALNVTPKDRITVNGTPVAAREPMRLWLYYKPIGLVTSNADEKGRETVFDHLPEDMPRVMSVGRLDLNSEGLLLLTNDGELKRRLELPSTGWLRKYRVRINGRPEDTAFEPLRKGIEVEGERFQPMNVVLDRQQGANAWLTIGLREGKNREIRRALAAIGFTVNRLIRVSYGPFRLNELEPGQVEEVRARVLRDQLGLDPEGDLTDELPSRRPGGPGAGKRGPGKPGLTRTGPGRPGAPRDDSAGGPAKSRPAKPFAARGAEGDTPRGPKPFTPRGAEGDAPRSGRPAKPYAPRNAEGDAPRAARPGKPFAARKAEGAAPRGPKADGPARPPRPGAPGGRGKAPGGASRFAGPRSAGQSTSDPAPPRGRGPGKPGGGPRKG